MEKETTLIRTSGHIICIFISFVYFAMIDFQWKEYDKAKQVKYSKNFNKIKPKSAHYLSTPVIINNFNQTESLQPLLDWLRRLKLDNIYLIDNHSTLPEIREYYEQLQLRVFYLDENLGPHALWRSNISELFCHNYYIYTDSDILPIAECPTNFLAHFYQLLDSHLFVTKVGFGLIRHDLPDSYPFKADVIQHELTMTTPAQEFEHGYFSHLGTTFALYKPHTAGGFNMPAIRTKFPYLIKHLGWYSDPNRLRETEKFYYQNLQYLTKWTLPYLKFLTSRRPIIYHSLNDFFGCIYSLSENNKINSPNIYVRTGRRSLLDIFVEAAEKSYRSILILNPNLQLVSDWKTQFEQVDNSWKILNLSNNLSNFAIGFDNSTFAPIISLLTNNCQSYFVHEQQILAHEQQILINLIRQQSDSHVKTFQPPLFLPNSSNLTVSPVNSNNIILLIGDDWPSSLRCPLAQWLKNNQTNQIIFLSQEPIISNELLVQYPQQTQIRQMDIDPVKLVHHPNLLPAKSILQPQLPDELVNNPLTQIKIGLTVYQIVKQLPKPILIICQEEGLTGYFVTCVFPDVKLMNYRMEREKEPEVTVGQILNQTYQVATDFHSEGEITINWLNDFLEQNK